MRTKLNTKVKRYSNYKQQDWAFSYITILKRPATVSVVNIGDQMECIFRFIIFSLALILCGCETTKLWRGDSTDEFIKIVPTNSSEDVEAALKDSGREYYCKDLYASTYPNNKVCYARLTNEDKIKNIQIKLLKTPETLAVDAGHTIKIVGSVALNIIMHSGYHKG